MVFRDKAKDGTTRLTGGLTVPGPPGRGIVNTTIEYQVGASGVLAPGGVWQPNPQPTDVGQYLWTRTTLTYTDAATTVSYSVAAHGATGPQGDQGDQGIPGDPGADGRGISSTQIRYQVGTSATSAPTGTWQTTPQATAPGQYLWTRTVITYTDATTSTSYSVAAHGSAGPLDPGWTSFTPNGTYFANYGLGYELCRYKKIGNQVFVGGMVTCVTAIPASTYLTFANMPVGYRPVTNTVSWPGIAGVSTGIKLLVNTAGTMQFICAGLASGSYAVVNGDYWID